MSNLSPDFVLKKSGEAVTDLQFWDFDSCGDSCRYLLSACGGTGGVDLWDLDTRRTFYNIPSTGAVATLSASGLKDHKVVTLDKSGNLILSIITNASSRAVVSLVISNVAFCKAALLNQEQNQSGTIVGVPGEEKSSFNVWDLENCNIIARLVPPEHLTLGMPMAAKLVKYNRLHACVGYEDGSMLLWDVMEHKVLSHAERIYTEPVMCLDTCDKGYSGICGSATNVITKWSIDDQCDKKCSCTYKTIKSYELPNPGVASVKIRGDSKIFATGGWDYKLRIFSWKTCKPLAVLEYHKGTVQGLAFSPPSKHGKQLLACGANDNKISIWDLYNK